MNACPNCGRDLPAAAAVCECGELLRAEVTHVHTWETETVFGKTSLARTRKNYAGVVAVVIGLTIFGFAWIGVRQNLNAAKTEQTATRSNTQVQLPTDSDILSADDELNAANASSQEGVFDFSTGRRPSVEPAGIVRNQNNRATVSSAASNEPAKTAQSGSLDDELLRSNSETVTADGSADAKPDCSPNIPLKRPEPLQSPADTKASTQKPTDTSKTYILGPRGGCFFVTAGGGKKYVDHSLCPQATTAAARQ